ncbi:MAG: HlyD family efflux transporter periplasmic adaptor subunit [Acidobacteria bacterium]|nr:HlyD family efflux transporter periplasmic adaptor subunit [Acidobacteriota bacterium]
MITNKLEGRLATTQPLDLAALGKTWTPPPPAFHAAPEAEDVLSGMPYWAARGLVYLIAGFVIAALLWAGSSIVDIVVTARGTLVPEGRVRAVQAALGGTVQSVYVKEGDTVAAGHPLVQIDAAELRARLTKLREELATSREQLRRLLASEGPVAATLEQQNRIARLESEAAAAEISLRQTTVRAPYDGVLTELAVRGPGNVVQAGQQVAALAPAGAQLVIEAQVLNKDMARIAVGLPVKLKFDAFPFQEYGVVNGHILTVAPDAAGESGRGASYKVTIQPGQASSGKTLALRSGMTATAEIITERKTILHLLLEPFRKLREGI